VRHVGLKRPLLGGLLSVFEHLHEHGGIVHLLASGEDLLAFHIDSEIGFETDNAGRILGITDDKGLAHPDVVSLLEIGEVHVTHLQLVQQILSLAPEERQEATDKDPCEKRAPMPVGSLDSVHHSSLSDVLDRGD
jgi:hypothetical protein